MTDWDAPFDAPDDPTWQPATWCACALIWLVCAPIDLLARPAQSLRSKRDGTGEGGNNNHEHANITGAERDHG